MAAVAVRGCERLPGVSGRHPHPEPSHGPAPASRSTPTPEPCAGSGTWAHELDAGLARLGRSASRDRLRLGEAFLALADIEGHHELGFSSFEAYALERCERGARWARTTKSLARRLRRPDLGATRRALRTGVIGWSMAELLSRHATRDTEEALLEAAASRTLRQMKLWLGTGGGAEATGASDPLFRAPAGSPDRGEYTTIRPPVSRRADPGEYDPDSAAADEDEPTQTASRAVGRAELRLLESTRMLVELLEGHRPSDECFVDALLAEAQSALVTVGGGYIPALPAIESQEAVHRRLSELRARRRELRARREAQAEPAVLAHLETDPPQSGKDQDEDPLPTSARGLDAEIVRLGRRLVARDLELGERARPFFARRAWRLLGFASAAQYARERIGLSFSSVQHRMMLARRAESLPSVGESVRSGRLGYEAAMIVTRIATPETVEAWVERAERRTLVHLREEVDAVYIAAAFGDEASAPVSSRSALPPDDALLERARAIERSVQDGSFLADALRPRDRGPQKSVGLTAGAGESIRFRISEDLWLHLRAFERRFQRVAEPGLSFFGYLCCSFWAAWLPTLEDHEVEWEQVYRRDRYRCTSPVCSRHDVTPHHLEFQSRGGGHGDENLTSPCTWCHLHGVHGDRLRADPPASNIRWTIGRDPILIVDGRERIRL